MQINSNNTVNLFCVTEHLSIPKAKSSPKDILFRQIALYIQMHKNMIA